jgi:hypothetical protein
VWRVACGVWRVACGVWRVACGVWRVSGLLSARARLDSTFTVENDGGSVEAHAVDGDGKVRFVEHLRKDGVQAGVLPHGVVRRVVPDVHESDGTQRLHSHNRTHAHHTHTHHRTHQLNQSKGAA